MGTILKKTSKLPSLSKELLTSKELPLMKNSPEESTEKLTPSKLKLLTSEELSSNSNSLVLLITPEFQAKLLLPVTLSISWITKENSSKDSELDRDSTIDLILISILTNLT